VCKEYFVVVFRKLDIQTGLCTGTKNIEDAASEIQQMEVLDQSPRGLKEEDNKEDGS
jgi:hypothetical protein